MITAIDNKTFSLLQKEILDALKPVADKYGLAFTPERGALTMERTSATFKIQAAVKGENGVALTREAVDFQNYCSLYGLKETDLNREFTFRGRGVPRRFQIVGLATSRPKFSIMCKDVKTGETVFIPKTAAIMALARES